MRRVPALRFLASAAIASIAAGAGAATYTVGPSGEYATIQAALDAASEAAVAARGGFHEIRVQRGVYGERLDLSHLYGGLLLRGGYGADFNPLTRSLAPEETTIDAERLGRALSIRCVGASVTIEGLAMTGGLHMATAAVGGGIFASTGADCRLTLRRLLVSGNRAEGATFGDGGGVRAQTNGRSRLTLEDVRIEGNEVEAMDTGFAGGGLGVYQIDQSELEILGTTVSANKITAKEFGGSAGAFVYAVGSGRVTIRDSTFSGNSVVARRRGNSTGLGVLNGGESATRIDLHRIQVVGNSSPSQVLIWGRATAVVTLSDSLVARGVAGGVVDDEEGEGDGHGVEVNTDGATHVFLTNLTVADNPGTGIRVSGRGGKVTIANTIVSGNGEDAIAPAPGLTLEPENLLGIDPLFVDSDAGDYHLLTGSPAIDAGDDAPESGLGPLDFDFDERREGVRVDVGADEAPTTGSGSHLCSVPRVGTGPFLPDFAPACRCLRDTGLRLLRCSFLLPELQVAVRFAAPFVPGEPTAADWTLHTWRPADGPFELALERLEAGRWVAVGKPFAGKLAAGQLATVRSTFVAPPASIPMRARVRHLVAGASQPVEDWLVLLPGAAAVEQP